MAKTKPQPINKPAAEQRKGGIVGFFQTIKMLWTNMISKIKDVLGIKSKVEAPQPTGPREFKPSDQIYEEARHFPGFYDLTLDRNGIIKLPQGTEELWPLDDKQRYLDVLKERFPVMPNPAETHNGSFITSISREIGSTLHDNKESTSIYAVGYTLVTTEIKDGECKLTISDGTNEKTATFSDPELAAGYIASLYTAITNNNLDANFYIDLHNGIRYAQTLNQEGGYDTYTIEQHHPHINDYDEKKFVLRKASLDTVMEVKGPGIMPRSTIDAAIKVENELQSKDFFRIMTAMHESFFEPPTEQSMYVTKDKMFWTTLENDKFMLHVAPAQCKYADIPTIDVEVPEAALDYSKDGCKALSKAASKASRSIDKQIQERDALMEEMAKMTPQEQPIQENVSRETSEPLEPPTYTTDQYLRMLMETAAMQGYMQGSTTMEFSAGEHKITIHGYVYEPTHEYCAGASSLSLDGKLLYGLDEKSTDAVGSCGSLEEALQRVQDAIGDNELTPIEDEPEPEITD